MEKILHNLADARRLASKIAGRVKSGQVFAFYGDLGAGKTTLIQQIALKLGVEEPVTSPTFVIQKKYATNKGFDLIHIDCYRFHNAVEAQDIGLFELMNPSNVCFVEWADKIEPLLPKDTVRIFLAYLSETDRKVRIEGLDV